MPPQACAGGLGEIRAHPLQLINCPHPHWQAYGGLGEIRALEQVRHEIWGRCGGDVGEIRGR